MSLIFFKCYLLPAHDDIALSCIGDDESLGSWARIDGICTFKICLSEVVWKNSSYFKLYSKGVRYPRTSSI